MANRLPSVAKLAKMLNKAHGNKRYRTTLLKCVYGVLFFGTPHRGSGLAHWGTMLSSILKAAALGSSTNSQLTKDLERKSKVLENISSSFIDLGKDLKIFSFHEVDTMDYLNCVVRNPYWAFAALLFSILLS